MGLEQGRQEGNEGRGGCRGKHGSYQRSQRELGFRGAAGEMVEALSHTLANDVHLLCRVTAWVLFINPLPPGFRCPQNGV